jgi:ribose transport system ATP-binding protein
VDTPLLSLQGIGKRFAGVAALTDVSIDVRPGEVHAVVGENGAGKSTLLRILSGELAPDAGDIVVAGLRRTGLTPRGAQEAGIRLIHQELALVPQLSAAANIYLGRQLRTRGFPTLDKGRMHERAAELLQRLGFGIDVRMPVSTLSIAQRQGVEIAKALLGEVRILCLDEPTSSITNTERDRLFAAIQQLQEDGVGILYVSHRMDELFAIAERATVLRDGHRIGCVEMAKVSEPELVRMMVGRDLADLPERAGRQPGREALRVRNLAAGPVRDVSFTAYQGQVLGIAGLMGSGRSEVLHAIYGSLSRRGGEVLLNGSPLNPRGPAGAIARGLGLIPEDRKDQGLVMGMSVSSNVALASRKKFSRMGVLRRVARREAVAQLARDVKIRPALPEQPVRSLSGGNQQKAVLGRWMLIGTRVLLLDEPTRGVDVGAKADIYRLIDQHVDAGGTVVLVSSELPEILHLSDRILVMRQGKVVGELHRAEATEEAIMSHATGGRPS